MANTAKVVYWGALDEKEDLTTGLVFRRGIPTDVPIGENGSTLARFIKTHKTPWPIEGDPGNEIEQLREFYLDTETPPMADLDALYMAYPDRVMAQGAAQREEYSRVAWTVVGKDEAEKEKKRAGALGEVKKAEKLMESAAKLKAEREATMATLNGAGEDDLAPTVRRGRKAAEAV